MIMIDLFNYPLVAILCMGLVIVLAATEFGRRLGMNANRKVEDDISTLEAAMLGLLALMIGFTFAMALSRFDTRRDAVLLEANAIERLHFALGSCPNHTAKKYLNYCGIT